MDTTNLQNELEQLIDNTGREAASVFVGGTQEGTYHFAANAPLRWAAPTKDSKLRLEIQSKEGNWISVDLLLNGDNYVPNDEDHKEILTKKSCSWREFSKSSELKREAFEFNSITVKGTAYTVATTVRDLTVKILSKSGSVPDFDKYRDNARGTKLPECPLKSGTYRLIKEVTEQSPL